MSNVPAEPGWDLETSPFHAGELAIQERMGVRAKIDGQGRRAVRRYLTAQQREFFEMLPYVFVGSVGPDGQPWASILMGQPGFVRASDKHHLLVRACPLFGDPLNETLREGAELSVLGVQLHTRRRNRAFGAASDVSSAGFCLAVRQSLGICPQYIHGREPEFLADPLTPAPRPVHRSTGLDDAAAAIIAKADTYFVASNDPNEADGETRGVDISHRGGRPGFVRVDDPHSLTAPDFVGNFMFNTLGNWQIDDRAGLLFIDFESGDLLYAACRAEVVWDGPELKAFVGAQRLVRYHVRDVIRVEAALPARFSAPDYSPLVNRIGSWEDVARTIEAEQLRTTWRPFRIVAVVDECLAIRSFHLQPDDNAGVAGFAAGQYLPIRVQPPGWEKPVIRTYTLSDAPDGQSYRITVKREGKGGVSDWLHDHSGLGDRIEALSPRGIFAFDEAADRPAVLLSAGVGITPMVAMLNSLLVNNGRTRLHHPVYFIHSARDGENLAFAEQLKRKAEIHSNLSLHIAFSSPESTDTQGVNHHSQGRIDRALLRRLLPLDDYEIYLCGPGGFMQAMYSALLSLGVRDCRIHFESFGPATVIRRRDTAVVADTDEGVIVEFQKSAKTAIWRPASGSVLDLAESEGIEALSSCRSGSCGTCEVRLLAGRVHYPEPPAYEAGEGGALICVARPHPGPHLEDGTLHREGIRLDL